jgi:hypothetical protein
MKKLLLIVIILASCLIAQDKGGPPQPIPPTAHLEICESGVIETAVLSTAADIMRENGCEHVEFDYIWDGFWIGHGYRKVVKNP